MYQWPAVVSDDFKLSRNVAYNNIKEQFLHLVFKIDKKLKISFFGENKALISLSFLKLQLKQKDVNGLN